MVRKELVKQIGTLLRENNFMKKVAVPKQVFRISDSDGNKRSFTIKKDDKLIPYDDNDINAVLDAMLYAIYDAIRSGDKVSITGFGTFYVSQWKGRVINNINGGDPIIADDSYAPRYTPGVHMIKAARTYGQSIKDGIANAVPPPVMDEEDVDGA